MGYKNWRTPVGEGKIFTVLHEEFNFTADMASSHANHLLPTYCTEEGKFTMSPVQSVQRGTKGPKGPGPHPVMLYKPRGFLGGLDPKCWEDERAFCNPPYAQEDLPMWVGIAGEVVRMGISPLTVSLLPPSTDVRWFQDLFGWPEQTFTYVEDENWIRFKTLDERFEWGFWRGRARFLMPKRTLPDGTPDETDPESRSGDQPRAGNLVVIHRG